LVNYNLDGIWVWVLSVGFDFGCSFLLDGWFFYGLALSIALSLFLILWFLFPIIFVHNITKLFYIIMALNYLVSNIKCNIVFMLQLGLLWKMSMSHVTSLQLQMLKPPRLPCKQNWMNGEDSSFLFKIYENSLWWIASFLSVHISGWFNSFILYQ
jgi:hypothetical protein